MSPSLLVLLHTALSAPRSQHRTERGDVPGWVLVVVMSVGLVTGIAMIAGPELEGMLQRAFNQVK